MADIPRPPPPKVGKCYYVQEKSHYVRNPEVIYAGKVKELDIGNLGPKDEDYVIFEDGKSYNMLDYYFYEVPCALIKPKNGGSRKLKRKTRRTRRVRRAASRRVRK